MVSKKLERRQMQVVDFDWFKRDERAVLAVLSLRSRLRHSANPGVNLSGWNTKRCVAKRGHRDADRLEEMGCAGALDTKMMTGTDLELKTVLLQEKALRASRAQQTLPRNLEENGER